MAHEIVLKRIVRTIELRSDDEDETGVLLLRIGRLEEEHIRGALGAVKEILDSFDLSRLS